MDETLDYIQTVIDDDLTSLNLETCINNWTTFQSKLLKKFQEKLDEINSADDDEDSDEE